MPQVSTSSLGSVSREHHVRQAQQSIPTCDSASPAIRAIAASSTHGKVVHECHTGARDLAVCIKNRASVSRKSIAVRDAAFCLCYAVRKGDVREHHVTSIVEQTPAHCVTDRWSVSAIGNGDVSQREFAARKNLEHTHIGVPTDNNVLSTPHPAPLHLKH
ncbi:MAG TPA: hypothetical protein VK846_06775 [Candidatus Limnocylindria bacterium]|nr:hypothetical protein [Candidatus Limnocylindria bacterium]